MIEVTNSVSVDCAPEAAWERISVFKGVGEPSKSTRRGTKVLDETKKPICDGMHIWQREKVGALTGGFVATVRETTPGSTFSWHTTTTYRLLGFPLKVLNGGTFDITENDRGVTLRHSVWAILPNRLLEWFARVFLDEEKAISDHNQTELHYFKARLEEPNHGT